MTPTLAGPRSPAQFQAPSPMLRLPRCGSTVRVVTTLAGLRIEGLLSAVNLVDKTITLRTRRFAQPLTLSIRSVSRIVELAPPVSTLDQDEAEQAQRARDMAAAIASLVSAAKAVPLSRATSPHSAPAPMSPLRAAVPTTTLNVSSPSFVPASAGASTSTVSMAPAAAASSVAMPAPAAMAPPVVYRVTSAPTMHHMHVAPTHTAYLMAQQQQQRSRTMRSVPMAVPVPAMTRAVSMVTRPMAHVHAPRAVYTTRAMPVAVPRERSVSPARSTSSYSSVESLHSQEPVVRTRGRSAKKINQPCKYFNTPKGCSRGPACRYRHDL